MEISHDGAQERVVAVVGMLDSIHLARWLEQFRNQTISFILFPSSPHRKVHPRLIRLIREQHKATFRFVGPRPLVAVFFWLADKLLADSLRAMWLRRVIMKSRPQVLHAIEFQHAGYIVLRALKKGKPADLSVAVTNYGSDIYWFRRFPSHEMKIRKLLNLADAYSAECQRDVRLARELGFAGEVKLVAPNAGGFSKSQLEMGGAVAADRPNISIKGYQGWVGRASLALAALEDIAPALKGLQIVVYSCNYTSIFRARRLARKTGLDVRAVAKGRLTHEEMLELFAKSKIYVGLSLSDGISTSLLEAMAMGAIPVQTSSSCCDEWFTDSGISVKELDRQSVGRAVLAGLKLAEGTEARELNRRVISERAASDTLLNATADFYGTLP